MREVTGYIEYFEELKKVKPVNLRTVLRDKVLDFVSLPLFLDSSLLDKPRIQFLYIHHIFKDEESALTELIQFLQQQHTFISYSDAVDRILTGRIDKPYIVFSSDDGLKNNLNAASVFSSFGISACFFINPFIIGQQNFEIVSAFCRDQLHFPPVEFMNWEDVHALQKMGHEIGSHTMKHINVAATEEVSMREDIFQSFETIKKQCGSVKHFAYPYGRFFHFNDAGRKAVFDAGFASCCSAERGCHINPLSTIRNDELLIRRDHIILDWKLGHIRYFLVNNARKATPQQNFFPI